MSVVVRRARPVALSFWLVLATSLTSAVALGAEPTPEDRTTARELALEGHRALKAGDYALAVDRFTRADRLVHAPTLLVDLGRSYLGLGQLVQAHETFQQVMREGVAADAPAPWHKALQAARDEDAALKSRLAWVTIRVEGADSPQVKLDLEPLPSASLGVRRALDPGRRSILAEAEGFLPAQSTIDVSEGETREVRLLLQRDPNYKPPAKPLANRRRPLIVVQQPANRQRTAAFVAFGVGGAGLVLGGVSSVMMLRARSELEPECSGGHCPPGTPNAASNISTFRTSGTLAAVGFGVAVAGAGAGMYFLLSRPSTPRASRSTTLTARVSPGYVGLSGSF